MPNRKIPFYTEQIYHVFNKTSDHRDIFITPNTCKRFIEILRYYRSTKAIKGFSEYMRLTKLDTLYELRDEINNPSYFKVDILQYCLMPNHFHLLIKQRIPTGITEYMTKCMSSFVHYYNLINERKGPLFIAPFKAIQVLDERQLRAVSSYIHLNPFKGKNGTLEKPVDFYYHWSSLKEYINPSKNDLTNKTDIMNLFDNDIEQYKEFILKSK